MLTAHCINCNSKVAIVDLHNRLCPKCRLFQTDREKLIALIGKHNPNATIIVQPNGDIVVKTSM